LQIIEGRNIYEELHDQDLASDLKFNLPAFANKVMSLSISQEVFNQSQVPFLFSKVQKKNK
jgi:hypothetical protein